jgi:hypothetical protein
MTDAAGTAMDEKVRIVLRVSFNRDGTLASQPWILNASFCLARRS